jgi:hypothetical protein
MQQQEVSDNVEAREELRAVRKISPPRFAFFLTDINEAL